MTRTPPDAQIFRPPYAYWNLLMPGVVAFGCIALVILLAVTESNPVDSRIFAAGIGLMVLAGLGMVGYSRWVFTRHFLAISPQGITYSAPGVYLHAHWQQAASIGKYAMRLRGAYRRFSRTTTVLYLKEPPQTYRVYTGRFALTRLDEPAFPVIPISDFAPKGHWQQHEIGQLIRQYAPQLLTS